MPSHVYYDNTIIITQCDSELSWVTDSYILVILCIQLSIGGYILILQDMSIITVLTRMKQGKNKLK
ncbi:MAG: hypothetical protein RBS43_01870 [Candidatus Cloacimonas sp.]|nr:hypothetical protein [Candidatus Cloacimonas sp.]